MALFGKKSSAGPPDDDLTFLSREDADAFRAITRQVFAERGLEVTIHADHAVDSAGREFGFWNVAAQCIDVPQRKWRSLVQAHVERVLVSLEAPDPFDGLTAEAAHSAVYARVYDANSVPGLDRYPYRELAPGLVEMLALDLPETVAIFGQDQVRDLGGWDALRGSGIANLEALPVEQFEQLPGPGGATFNALFGESVYTASRMLLLPELASLGGEEPGQFGWLMSVPNRHQVTWHVVRNASVFGAVEGMARFAALGFSDSPGPVSPHVFWWNGTAYEQLTALDGDNLTIRPSAAFADVLEQIASE